MSFGFKKVRRVQKEEPKEEPVRRRRKRKPEPTSKKETTPKFKLMISVKDQMPPDNDSLILTWGSTIGFQVIRSDVVVQHINYDLNQGIFKLTHWFPLEEI